ncbi:non-ribosomal peptide synthetase [Corynebacterium oculi]|uniref:Anguibactin system regulator n=1 Tax=Corynebacterium oculi TaxID=1544416 RepID=A0A0Q0Z2P5_9CORY|nr:non-ribosomal peptide synthetase [Corynebacterium oculi]KQB83507.1 Anguibactin system regulator [Corynebacterium oculi]
MKSPQVTPGHGSGEDRDHVTSRPLTGTQRAYLSGREEDQLYGGVDCLALFEFIGDPIDGHRLRTAVAALRRHPVLRSTIVEGRHIDAGQEARPPLTIVETEGAGTHEELTAYLAGHRREILGRHANHAAGESGWLDILRWRTDDGHEWGILHIGISLAVADLAGTGIIVRELAAAYRSSGVTRPWVTFADIAGREKQKEKIAPAGTLPRATDHLPEGPNIPLVGTPERTVTRHVRRLGPESWARIGVIAEAAGATRSGLLLAVYRHALGLWCGSEDFTVIVPGLDARSTPGDVLDRTRMWAVRPPSAIGRTLGEASREASAELRRRIRTGLDSTEEVRALLRQSEGHSGSLPFVLTCGGEEVLFPHDVLETFGQLTATGSVTPQVLVDLQILRLTSEEVCVALDVRDGAFPNTFGPELLGTVTDALERIAASEKRDAGCDDRPMDEFVRLSGTERRDALNSVPPVDSAASTLHGAWLRQVEERPRATAVIDSALGANLTYAELHHAALRLAAELVGRVAPGDLVLIRLPKGRDQITAVLATLYLGAGYLPVSVDTPDERLRAITEAAQPAAVIDQVAPEAYTAGETPADLPRAVDGEDRAYVIFTSGSTGTPKGVVMTHRAAANTVAAVVDRHGIGPQDSVLAVSSLDFDLSVFDIFGLLGAGGTVVCIAQDDHRDAFAWCELIRRHGVTTWNSAPALAEMLTVAAEEGPDLPLRLVLVSGDWVSPTLPARVRAVTAIPGGARVVAMGGATEGGIWSNAHVIDGPEDLDPAWPSVPYGRPLPGQAYRIVDAAGRDVPGGVVGELWIGGLSLATGYLSRPDLTAERFITDTDGSRWYRTGDHGYWGDDDLLFFVGRRDNQVKIRGHRVELGDVEHHLRALDGVEAAVVLPEPGNTALRALVAAAGNAQTADRVREALAATLPGFMVPRDVTVVPQLRLTANGKIDRAWAERVLTDEEGKDKDAAPRAPEIEADVAAAWAAVLGTTDHAGESNFFALGGDSVGATSVCSRLRALGYRVTAADLFGNPTFDRFAAAVEAAGRMENRGDEEAERRDHMADVGARFPLTPLQRAYALGTDGIQGTVRAATAYAAILSSAGVVFTSEQVRGAAEGLVTRWAGLRVIRDGDDAQHVVQPRDALLVTVLHRSADLRGYLSSATPRVPLELVLPGEKVREVGVLINYLALDGRSLAVILGALTAALSGENPDLVARVNPSAEAFARHCYALTAEEDGFTGLRTVTPEPPVLPLAAASHLDANTPLATFESIRARVPLAALERSEATISAVVLSEFGSLLAQRSGMKEVGIVVPLSYRPDGDDREVLGAFSRLGVCACPAVADPAATHAALAAALTGGSMQIVSNGRTGRYPVVFTSVVGYDAALVPASREVRVDWSLTRTPGVLIDCQLTTLDEATVEIRWDMPVGVLDRGAVDEMFCELVGRLGGTVSRTEPATVSALLKDAMARLDASTDLVPWAAPVVAAWRRFVTDGPEAAGCADAPVAWSAQDAQLLADIVRGRARRFAILDHPVLSPRALAAAQPTVARALDALNERVLRRAEHGDRVNVVELGYGIGGATPEGADSWIVVEPDEFIADIATVNGRTCVLDAADLPSPADVVVACGTLHRDSRLRAELAAVPLARGAEVHVIEAEHATAATLVSAALVNPAMLGDADDRGGLLPAAEWSALVAEAGLSLRYFEAEDGHSVILRAVAADTGADTSAATTVPAASDRREVTTALTASWRRHLPDLPGGDISDDTDFFAVGGDSLAATRVLADLREAGVTGLRAVDVFNNPTFGELRRRVAGGRRGVDTHPLTRVQQAYLAGGDSEQLLGGAPARCLFVFHAPAVDTSRLEAAVRTAVRRHPVLRTVIVDGPDGAPVARITAEHSLNSWAVTDDAVTELRDRAPDPRAEGPLAVRVSLGPDGATIAVSMNNLLLDGASMMLLMNEIEERYTDPKVRGDDTASAAAYLSERPWLTDPAAPVPWQGRMLSPTELDERLDTVIEQLPPAPFVPDRQTLAQFTDSSMARVGADIDAAAWEKIRAGFATRRITPAAGVLAAFGRALSAETGEDSHTINLTRFDRDLSAPGIDRVLGDFTSLSLAALHGLSAGDRAVAERSAQDAVAGADDPARDTLRLAARAVQTSGDPVAGLFPVVFTCALGLTSQPERSLRERSFGTQIEASSTTPQVVLDLQVADDGGGLHLTADYLVQVMPEEVARRVVRRTVAELTDLPSGDAAVLAEAWAQALGLDRVTEDTNFFRAGGDSLAATRCISTLRARGINVALRTLLTMPDFGTFRDAVIGTAGEPTRPDAPEGWFDLTDVQASYLMGRTTAYEDGGVACQGYSEFALPLDRLDAASAADPVGAVRRAWRKVVDAHEMLRALVDREGRQRIDHTAEAHVRVIDVSTGETGTGVTAPDPETARDIVRAEAQERNFPVGQAPMVELTLTVGSGDPVLHLSVDLIVTDYVGIRSLVRDLDHCLRNPSAPLEAPAMTFRQCLEARARHAETPEGRAEQDRDARWWRDRLDSLPPALIFSPDPDATGLGGTTRRSHRLDAEAWRGLCDTAAGLAVTPSGLVLAAFATAAQRYADIGISGYAQEQDSALVTLTTVNRAPLEDGPSAAEMERIVGDFTSTVVLDLPLGGELAPTVKALQRRLFDALDHAAYPGVRVLRDLRRAGGEDRGRIPIVFTSTVGVDTAEPPQILRAVPGTAISKTPQVLLDVQLSPDGEAVTMDWDSRDGGFHPAVLDALFADVQDTLDRLAAGDLDVPSPRQPEPVVRTRSMNGRLLHGRFLRAALDAPESPAIIHGDRTMSRGELCATAVRIAEGLPGGRAPVAVLLPPGEEQIAAQLAALLTGRAFVPLDPDWPKPRIRAVLDIVRRAYTEEVPVIDDATLWAAREGDATEWRDAVRRALAEPLTDELAYVIFTSGSTGTPKGVTVTHRQVCATLDEMEERLGLTDEDRVLAVSRPSFDLAIFNIFGVLGAGGTVVVPACGTVPDPETWARDLRRHGVTLWNSVPAQLTILLDHLGDADGATEEIPLRAVLVSGDRVPVNQPARVRAFAPKAIIDALGGATEGSIWSIAHRCTPEQDATCRSVPYGRALGHQAVWVLDRSGGRAAIGQRGEIVIAGDGVAEGYLGDPERTEAAFGQHPGTGERCYRTGDIGRYLPDGEIEFCGRVDDGQIKIRGHRIELGEVEAGLRQIEGVADALAAVTGEGDRKELVAVVVPEATSPLGALAAAVTARSRAEGLNEDQSRDFRRIHELVTAAALDAMTAQIARVTLGSPDGTASRDEIVAGTGAQARGTLIDRWIEELERAGRLRRADGRVSVVEPGIATEDHWAEIYRLDERLGYGRRQLDYLRSCLNELPGLLEGSVDPLSLLFPAGDMSVARAAYGENLLASYLNRVCAAAVAHHARSLSPQTCRILEIGAGVGGTTAEVIKELPETGVDYLFTDVSRYFTGAAEQEWPQVRTALFDINADPDEQGVEPGSVDVVLCANVVHNARNIGDALGRIDHMLAPGGLFVAIDSTATNAPLMASMEFKEGLGEATDDRLITGSPFFTLEQWRKALDASPLTTVAVFPEPGSALELGAQHAFIARKSNPKDALDAAEMLPEQMRPRRIGVVEALPLTANGKRDRAAVAALVSETRPTSSRVAASVDPVTDAWRRVLGLDPSEPLTGDADFYDLGGDSLLLARCIGQMRRAIDREDLPSWDETLRAIVADPTIDGCRRVLGLTVPKETAHEAPSPTGGPRLTWLLPCTEAGMTDLTVMVHDGSGGIAPYAELLRELTERGAGPVLGIERSAGDNYLTTPPETLFHDLAERYAASVLETEAQRVHVIGYCMGGLLAAGIADRLAACGVEAAATVMSSYRIPFTVRDEILLDFSFARLMKCRPQDMGIDIDEDALGGALRAARRDGHGDMTAEVLHGYASENLRAQLARVPRTSNERIGRFLRTEAGRAWSQESLAALRQVYVHSLAAVAAWSEPPVTVPVTFLRQRDPLSFLPDLGEDMTAFWTQECQGGLEIIDIDGDHFTCLDAAHAPAVADLVLARTPWWGSGEER